MTSRTRQSFGSAHTVEKLKKLESYLEAYTTALKRQGFQTIYVDAFAGTGGIEMRGDAMPLFEVFETRNFIEGSVRRALSLKQPFDRYLFAELDRNKVAELQNVISHEFVHLADRITVVNGDANEAVRDVCENTPWRQRGNQCRAVVFLDPFGNSVTWQTLEVIAATRSIDLWYLFPAGWGVNRQISNDGSIHFTHAASLTRLYGSEVWEEHAREVVDQPSLLENDQKSFLKRATPASMTRLMVTRMKEIFKGGVLDEWLPLGENGRHDFSLIFAWANPDPKAALAAKLARAVLKSKAKNGWT